MDVHELLPLTMLASAPNWQPLEGADDARNKQQRCCDMYASLMQVTPHFPTLPLPTIIKTGSVHRYT